MWNKIYLILLAIAVVGSGALLYIANSWLGSISDPKNVVLNYGYYANISWSFLLISSLILLVAGNVLLFKNRKSWALWATFLYFSVFMILHTFWLGESYFKYKQSNGLADGSFSLGSFVGVLFVALAAIFIFFNQYLVKRMQSKMISHGEPIEQLPDENLIRKDDI